MRLESVSKIVSTEMRKIENAKKDSAPSKAAAYSRKPDNANLSSDAKDVHELKAGITAAAARIQAEPDVRSEKISEVRKKMDEGYYNSSKFAENLADRLIKDLGL